MGISTTISIRANAPRITKNTTSSVVVEGLAVLTGFSLVAKSISGFVFGFGFILFLPVVVFVAFFPVGGVVSCVSAFLTFVVFTE